MDNEELNVFEENDSAVKDCTPSVSLEVTVEDVRRALALSYPLEAEYQFTMVFNSNPVNIFSFLSQKLLNSMKRRNVKGKKLLTINHPKLPLKYSLRADMADLVTLDGRSAQFLWFLIAKFAMMVKMQRDMNADIDINKYTIVAFRQSEIAQIFNVSPQHARIIVQEGYITLKSINWRFTEVLPGIDTCEWQFSPVASMVDTKRFGYVGVRLNQDFVRYLSHTYIKFFPIAILRIQPKRFPNALAFAIKLVSNYNINDRKETGQRNTVSVKTLLGVASYIPKEKDVIEGGSRLNQRIVKPFIRDMNHLKELHIVADWCFKWPNSSILIEPDYKNISYDKFLQMNVFYAIPDRNGRLPEVGLPEINKNTSSGKLLAQYTEGK